MNDASQSLDALRREIDTVDDALHDLLMRRAALVADIGVLKNSEQVDVFRPAREAVLLRRLLTRNDGNLPVSAVVRIWREVIAASTLIQGGLMVAYCPIGDVVAGDRLARGRFGAGAAVVPVSTPAQVVTAVASGEASVGLVPVPRQDDKAPWWPLLYGRTGDAAIQVVAGVPFVLSGGGEELSAFIIARGQAEPSGDDRSLVVLECGEPISRDRVCEVLAENGFDPAHTVSYDDPGRPGTHLHMADLAGHVALDDPRLSNVRQALPAMTVWQVGVYAAPMGENG
ncbi:MAG: chorismate mutase [Alphaproteobacteria bacterium]|nr:chorismate mutase [Alphaproteobacteria bacterium]